MSYAGSGGDDQSEDGELRHSPPDTDTKTKDEVLDFSLSDEDVDTADSLDIKPPQANRLTHASGTSRNKRRERNREGRSRHGRSERHREERSHAHREKHHRERVNRDRERETTYREKEYFRERDVYRDKEIYARDVRYAESGIIYKDSKYMEVAQYRADAPPVVAGNSRDVRYMEQRKYEEKRKEMRYLQEPDKYRRYEEKQDRRVKSAADQTLDDLRERLLDKKRQKETEDYSGKHHDKESRRRARAEHLESLSRGENTASLEQDAEMYVKEIIDLSGNTDDTSTASVMSKERSRKERHHKREQKERDKVEVVESEVPIERKLTEAECEEQELRKEKLLQAEREIARQKEQYKMERERRHQRRLERQEKRRLQEEQQQLEHQQRKRARMSGELGQYKDKDLSIVTVSDASSRSSESAASTSGSSHSSDRSRSNSPQSRSDNSENEANDETTRETSSGDENEAVRDDEDDDEDDDNDNEEDDDEGGQEEGARKKRRYKSDDDARDHIPEAYRRDRDSSSRSQSKSLSPSATTTAAVATTTTTTTSSTSTSAQKSNGQLNEKDETDVVKAKSPEVVMKKIDEALPPYFPAIQGCRSVEEFQCLNRIEEGTYGVVYRARDKRTEEIVALKRLKMEKEKEGFPITSLREINTLLKGQHPNIVTVREIVVGSNMDKIFIVMDYVEHDLKSLMETMRNRRQVFLPAEVKCLLKQLLGAVAHLHDNWILHRDLKTSNLLLSHKGILKVGDFGLAREYGSPLKPYTPIVVTLWYRAPELLLCCKEYSTPIDIWSVGCIFAELLLMNALFPGKSEIDQLNRIFKDLGTPNERIWPGYNELPAVKKMKFTEYPVSSLRTRFNMLTDTGLNILQRFLTYDPAQRITADDALKHAYFTEPPLPIDPAMFPTWPAKSELGHRKAMAASPKPPSGGKEYKQLGDGDEDSALGFHMGTSTAASLHEQRRLAMGGGFSLKF